MSVLAATAAVAYLAQPVASQTSSGGTVRAWLTTPNRAHLLAEQATLGFGPDSGTTPLTIDVDPSLTYQVMDGFGASFTDSSAWLVYNKLSAAARHDLLVRLFDRTDGIALDYLRQPIGAPDFALSRYTYDDVPAGQTDTTLARFSIDHDKAYILPVIKEALAINPDLRVMASPWSAPAWMKTNGSLIGGSLNTAAEASFANYLVKFVQAYRESGVPIERLTPQNEPHYTPPDYPGMWMDAAQEARLIGDRLGPALAAAGLPTRIDAWDQNWDDANYAPAVFSDTAASAFVSGSAWHCYAGAPAAMSSVHGLYPDKEILQTECSGAVSVGDFAQSFSVDMEKLVIGSSRNWARTIMKWNIALDPKGGPHTGGCSDCTGLVTIDPTAGTVASYNYDYYALGHASKFVLPGAVRIGSNSFGSSSIEDVAFRNPDGSRVLVVFNADATTSHTFKVREFGRSFAYTLSPRAAVTFTWTDTGTGGTSPANLALNRPATASSSENSSQSASNAVDGSTSTRWSSAFADPQWLKVDLGNRYRLSKVVLDWEAAYAVAYQVQVSDDGSAWTTVYSTTTGQGGTEVITPTTTAAGRYLRVLCTQRAYVYGQQWGYSLWEVQAFGSLDTSSPPVSSNLALNRPATASSSEDSSLSPAKAVDGSTTTRWSSGFSDAQWLRVDLGSRFAISKVVLNWEAAYAVAYQVQVSDDASAWTTVYSTTAGQGGTETIAPVAGAAGRYLRILCSQRAYVYGQQWGYSLWEVQAFGTAASSASPNLALNRPATASSSEDSSLSPAKAVDGSTTTRWSSGFSDAQWLRVDLGSRFAISKVVLNWEAAYAVAYQVQVSDDASAWTTVYSTKTGQGGTEAVVPAAGATGRYVRILCSQRAYVYGQQWGYSLWEVGVFGTTP